MQQQRTLDSPPSPMIVGVQKEEKEERARRPPPSALDAYWLGGLPRPPEKKIYHLYETFTFSMQMLPSINSRTTRGTYTVRSSYRERELTEINRITAQRDAVGWTVSERDAYLLLYVFSFENARADIHNPTKPTCDLFGQGRYEWVGSGRLRRRDWTNHAWVIWNDNRVWDERLVRVVEGRRTTGHWATITVVKYDISVMKQINPHRILYELGTQFDPRVREEAKEEEEEERPLLPSPVSSPLSSRRTHQKGRAKRYA